MECKYNVDEFCTNDQCPMCGDYCPVPNDDGVCKYEERVGENWILFPKGCLICALRDANIILDDDTINLVWDQFSELMTKFGYVEED